MKTVEARSTSLVTGAAATGAAGVTTTGAEDPQVQFCVRVEVELAVVARGLL